MNWKNEVVTIQERIRISNRYEDYVPLLESYKKALELAFKTSSSDVEIAGQLASVYLELRDSADKCTGVLEGVLENDGETLNPQDKSRLLTNLAYHHGDGWYLPKDSIKYLKEAVSLGSEYEQTYDALGVLLTFEEKYQEAIGYFEKAIALSGDIRHRYHRGVGLYGNDQIREAMEIFEAILKDDDHVKAKYSLAVCCASMGEVKKALELIHEVDETKEMGKDDFGDIYFICGEYQLCCEAFYDKDEPRLVPSVDWLEPYFYSLKILGKTAELSTKFDVIMNEKKEAYDEAIVEEMGEDETEEERKEYLQGLCDEMLAIELAYKRVVYQGKKPVVKIRLWCEAGCYLIDCVRHQKEE